MTVAEKYDLPKCVECIYFVLPENQNQWDWDKDGNYKVATNQYYTCSYNGAKITSWENVRCPKKK